MAKSIIQTVGVNVVNSNLTTYFTLFGTLLGNTTEAFKQSNLRPAGTLSNLRLNIDANSVTATSTFRLRKNGANGNQSVSIGSSATGEFTDSSNTDSIAAGDDVNYQIVTGATGTSITPTTASIIFNPTDSTVTATKFGTNEIGSSSATLPNNYPLTGKGNRGTSESQFQTTFKKAGTLQYLDVRVETNARTTTTTVRSRKNTANGAMSVSITSTATGAFEDTTNSDTITVNDLICYLQTPGTGAQAQKIAHISSTFVSSSSAGIVPLLSQDLSTTATVGSTNYSAINSTTLDNITNIARVRTVFDGIPGDISNLRIQVNTNTSAASSVKLDINGSDSTLAASITASTTGAYEDTTNTSSVSSGQTIQYKLVVGAGGSFQYRQINSYLTAFTQVTQAKTHKYNIETLQGGKSLIGCGKSKVTQAINITRYYHLVGGCDAPQTTEAFAQSNIRPAGTLSNLSVVIDANSNTGTSTWRLRKNTANGSESISIASSTSGHFADNSNTDSVAAGDDFCFSMVTGTTGSTLSIFHAYITFTPTVAADTYTKMGCVFNFASSTASTTNYFPFQSASNSGFGTEIEGQTNFRKAGALQYLDVRISTNARTTATTYRTRKNTANGAQSVSVGSTATGAFEDTTNSDTIAIGDLANLSQTTGTGTGAIQPQAICVSFYSGSSNGLVPIFAQETTAADPSRTVSTTKSYYHILGATTNFTTPNNQRNVMTGFEGYLTNTQVVLSSNTSTVSTTAGLSIDDVDSTIAISISASASGTFEDTVNSDKITSGQTLANYFVSDTSGTGSLVYRQFNTFFTHTTQVTTTKTHKYDIAAGGAVNYPVTISEPTISISETLARIQNRIFAINESTISVSEALARIQSLIKTISDPSISVSETLARVASYLKPISNETAITVNQTLVATKSFLKAITTEPAVVVSETIARIQNIIKTIAEPTVSRSETLTKIVSYIKAINTEPSVSVSQTLTATRSFLKAITTEAAITVSDTLQKLLAATRPITGVTTTTSDSIIKIQSLIKQISESTINVSDSLQGSLLYIISVIESRVKWYYSLLTKKN